MQFALSEEQEMLKRDVRALSRRALPRGRRVGSL